MHETLALQIVLIGIAGIAAQWVAWRVHLPAIVFLLAAGFILGPVTHLVEPYVLKGDLLKPAISAAVAIILFEGSLQLHFKELKNTRWAVRHIIWLGAPLGWIGISFAAHYIAGLEWAAAVTLGGMLVVTGPTVIMPLLRQARLKPRVANILKWEGIVNDSVGVLFAIFAYEYFVASKNGEADMAFFLKYGFTCAFVAAISFAIALMIKRLFARGMMPEYLKTPFLVCVVLTLFFACDVLLQESGLIAVTVLGLTLTNINMASLEEIKRFKEGITILLVSGVFILLTANLDISVLLMVDWRGLCFILALLFIIRPVVLFLCTVGTEVSNKEVLLAGLIAPRGVVCAAMAGIVGPLLVDAGFPDGEKILPLAFALVIVSVVLHSLMIKPLAEYLDLRSEETNGVIIAGAYPWTIQLAEVLRSRNVPIMIVDNDWSSLKRARLADLPVYYGELLSEETEFTLEFNRYNTLIAAMPNAAYNALLCEKFGYDYGKERVFRVNADEGDISERRRIATAMQGRRIVADSVTLDTFMERFGEGWRFRAARVGRIGNGDLIIPEAGEQCFLVGGISGKTNAVSFYSHPEAQKSSLKENDYVLTFTSPNYKERETEAPAPLAAPA